MDLVVEGGVQACTFSAVAERAGVERSTLYRRFPDRWDAIIDTWMDLGAAEVMPDLGGTFAGDLLSILKKLRDTLQTPLGPALLSVAAELSTRDPSEFTHAFFDRRMAQLAPMFDAAIARGELEPDVDREVLFTLAAGPIYFRMFIAVRAVEDDFLETVVDGVCRLHCRSQKTPKVSSRERLA